MEDIKISREKLIKSLEDLRKSIEFYEKSQSIDDEEVAGFMYKVDFVLSQRKSLIKSFEFNMDQFWKYLKKYLDKFIKPTEPINGPRPVIRASCKYELITGDDAQLFLDMIDNRNKTSHMYEEEMSEMIAHDIPKYYEAMQKCLDDLVLN